MCHLPPPRHHDTYYRRKGAIKNSPPLMQLRAPCQGLSWCLVCFQGRMPALAFFFSTTERCMSLWCTNVDASAAAISDRGRIMENPLTASPRSLKILPQQISSHLVHSPMCMCGECFPSQKAVSGVLLQICRTLVQSAQRTPFCPARGKITTLAKTTEKAMNS